MTQVEQQDGRETDRRLEPNSSETAGVGSYLVPPLRLLSSIFVRYKPIGDAAAAAAALLSSTPSATAYNSLQEEQKPLPQTDQLLHKQHIMNGDNHDEVHMTTVSLLFFSHLYKYLKSIYTYECVYSIRDDDSFVRERLQAPVRAYNVC